MTDNSSGKGVGASGAGRGKGFGRIASNSLLLFVRMLAVMVVNLYAVRLLIKGLGMEDYGVYNAVAGLVALSTLLSGVLDVAMQRFYSFYMGKGEGEKVSETFTLSLRIVVVLAVAVVLLAETAGLWVVQTHLVFPAERMGAVMVCYQTALLVFVCTLVRIPFGAAVFAHEDMNWYAGISIVECLLRLGAAWSVAYVALDALGYYSCAYALTAVAVLVVYVWFCRKRYKECRIVKTGSRALLWEIFSFSGWNFFGAAAKVSMTQGTLVMLNIFFGPVTTAAYAVAIQVQNAFNTFANTIVLAIRPQMIKSYAEGDHGYLSRLFMMANKLLYYLLLVVALPLTVEMPTILSLWLKETNAEMVLFCRAIVVYVVVLAMNGPITVVIHATGRMRRYTLWVESVTLLCLPVMWLLLSCGLGPQWAMGAMIGLCVVAHGVRLVCLRAEYGRLSLRAYCLHFVAVAAVVTVLLAAVGWGISLSAESLLWRCGLWVVGFGLAAVVLLYSIGLSGNERSVLRQMAMSKLRRGAASSKPKEEKTLNVEESGQRVVTSNRSSRC